MDKVEKKEIVLTVNNSNIIQINGKKPTKSFISQIPLEDIYTNNNDIAYHIGWINMVFDSSAVLRVWGRYLNNPTKIITILSVTMGKKLRRTYISTKELKEIEKEEGELRQIYI